MPPACSIVEIRQVMLDSCLYFTLEAMPSYVVAGVAFKLTDDIFNKTEGICR